MPVAFEFKLTELLMQITELLPVIAPATGRVTVTVNAAEVAEHPFASVTVYVMLDVPVPTPVTTPVLLTVTTAVFAEAQL